ncbi:deoxyribodipyrimidine photo-lyase [Rhodococcus sp. NPDC049939]|uniref:cryptochrome/photolyase family protein n=1 Tax=Rhodococcus sp. NPDC049939 TaxID=3155511 RepID=UPI0033CF677A
MDTALVWFRRDLRLGDLPTLRAVAEARARALGLFVLDDRLLRSSGEARRGCLFRSLAELDEQLDGRLLVVKGDPVDVVPAVAREVAALETYVSADYGPYGRKRDAEVAERTRLVASGSPYAVAPGTVLKTDGQPYRVFTPYFRHWLEHGWEAPIGTGPATVEWLNPDEVRVRRATIPASGSSGCAAGEEAALKRWEEFCGYGLGGFSETRDRPDLDATSRMSVFLRYGNIHPRTMLHDLARCSSSGAQAYRRQLAWRDFYADILFHRPDSARGNYDRRFDHIRYDTGPDAEEAYRAWCEGRTGFPIVDAGMRQLRAEGWMHNRVRMIVASFFVKDLHLPWWRGARYFMNQLADGDLASNQHGWQWTAGSGTDASPYFRIFNPTTQGEKFDPDGEYVRRWIPELRGVRGKAVHTLRDGRPEDYPSPIVDHAHERREALARYAEIKKF